MSLTWQDLHRVIGLSPDHDSADCYEGVNSLAGAVPGEVSFLGNSRYQAQLTDTSASVVLVPEGDFSAPAGCQLITVASPSTAFSKVVDHFHGEATAIHPGIAPGAHVHPDAVLDPSLVQVNPGAVIEAGARIGKGSIIGAGCLIGREVVIGENCLLHPGAIIRERCTLGDRVILQPGCVIGSDGYGFDLVNGRHEKVPQIGIVEIHDDVEVGANSCLDRARFGKTIIGEGTKIDNLVQIAHNVTIGKHCLIVAQSGVAGSSHLGQYVTIAAQAGVAGHLKVADQSVLAAQGGLLKSIKETGVFMGTPARPMKAEQRKLASLSRLPKLRAEVQELKKKLEELAGE